jgi:bifunctional oligoribonuclease and PAP phosphatase NrnA
MTNNPLNWGGATALVDAAQTILIVTHVKPDGDAIGSMLGLGNALRERGKKVDAAVDGGVPDFAAFLPNAGTVAGKLESGQWDLMISVDVSDEDRYGQVGAYGRGHSGKLINIDHHPTNPLFGEAALVDATAVSTTEVIYEWLLKLGHPISKDVAVPLLTGLVTDTLSFRTSNVKPSTLGIAQQLMAAGASLTEINARTLDSKPYNVVKLWRETLPSMELNGQVISACIRQEDIKNAGVSELANSGGLVQLLINVNEAMIAVLFKELADGRIELSMRSKPGYDVASVALEIGGGGHKQAAGATIDGPLEVAKARVLPLLQQAAERGILNIV